jgi:hypothetical protein
LTTSSATSTIERRPASSASSFHVNETSASSALRPWQFFVMAALIAATAGVILSRGTSPANIILISVTIGTAALAGIAVYRMLSPLVAADAGDTAEMLGGRTRAALEREKMMVLRSIKELEFDRAMDKISEQDYEEMVARLRARAVRLIRQLDAGESGYRELIERELAIRLGRAAASKKSVPEQGTPSVAVDSVIGGCGACGTMNEADARFCKQCGGKLLALLLAFVLCLPSLVLAQPDPRQMSGIPRPDGNLPNGTITVRVIRGSFANNVVDQTVELRAGSNVQTTKTDANGRATFLAPAAGTVVRAATVVDGETLESQEFPAPSVGGVAVMLVASGGTTPQQPARTGTVSFGPESRVVVDLVDETLQVYYLLEIINPAPYPVMTEGPVILDLPTGSGGAGPLEGTSPQVVIRGNRVTAMPPFQPGVTAVNVGYSMPYYGANLTISQTLPLAASMTNIAVRKIGDMQLESPQVARQQQTSLSGNEYIIGTGQPIAADGVLTLDLKGLPHHSTVPRIVSGVLVGCVVLIGLWGMFSGRNRTAEAARRKRLEARREKAFAELVRLEEQKRAGKIDAARHETRRAALLGQLDRIYGELDDAARPRAGGDEGLAA